MDHTRVYGSHRGVSYIGLWITPGCQIHRSMDHTGVSDTQAYMDQFGINTYIMTWASLGPKTGLHIYEYTRSPNKGLLKDIHM